MNDEPLLLPEARDDIADTYPWYEERVPGLGIEFLGCFEEVILSVQRFPLRHPVVHEGYRRAVLRRFPYSVYYELDGNQIVVHAVFHQARDSAKWRERISK